MVMYYTVNPWYILPEVSFCYNPEIDNDVQINLKEETGVVPRPLSVSC